MILIIIMIMIIEAAMFVSMRIKTARPWSNARKKPEETINLRRNFKGRRSFMGKDIRSGRL